MKEYNHQAIRRAYPNKKLLIQDDIGIFDLDTNEKFEYDQNIIDIAESEIKAEHERTEYQRQRKLEYPPITDQLDALFKAGIFPPEMAAQIQEVKDKYPKPK